MGDTEEIEDRKSEPQDISQPTPSRLREAQSAETEGEAREVAPRSTPTYQDRSLARRSSLRPAPPSFRPSTRDTSQLRPMMVIHAGDLDPSSPHWGDGIADPPTSQIAQAPLDSATRQEPFARADLLAAEAPSGSDALTGTARDGAAGPDHEATQPLELLVAPSSVVNESERSQEALPQTVEVPAGETNAVASAATAEAVPQTVEVPASEMNAVASAATAEALPQTVEGTQDAGEAPRANETKPSAASGTGSTKAVGPPQQLLGGFLQSARLVPKSDRPLATPQPKEPARPVNIPQHTLGGFLTTAQLGIKVEPPKKQPTPAALPEAPKTAGSAAIEAKAGPQDVTRPKVSAQPPLGQPHGVAPEETAQPATTLQGGSPVVANAQPEVEASSAVPLIASAQMAAELAPGRSEKSSSATSNYRNLAIGFVSAALVGGVVMMMVGRSPSSTEPTNTRTPPTLTPPATPQPEAPPKAPVTTQEQPAAEAEEAAPITTASSKAASTPPPPGTVRVRLEVKPNDAKVNYRGQAIAGPPFEIDVQKGKSIAVEIVRRGFVTTRVVVDGKKPVLSLGMRRESYPPSRGGK